MLNLYPSYEGFAGITTSYHRNSIYSWVPKKYQFLFIQKYFVYYLPQVGFEPGSVQDGCIWRLPSYCANTWPSRPDPCLYTFNLKVTHPPQNCMTTKWAEKLKVFSGVFNKRSYFIFLNNFSEIFKFSSLAFITVYHSFTVGKYNLQFSLHSGL